MYLFFLTIAFVFLLTAASDAQTYWAALPTPPEIPRCIAVTSNGDVYIGTSNGLYRHTALHPSWQPVTFPTALISSIVCSSNNVLFAATSERRIYRSTDNGTTWTSVLNLGGGDSDSHNLLVDKNNRLYAAATKEYGVRYSDNEGTTWAELNNGLIDTYINSIAFDASNRLMACTEAEGLFVYQDDLASWQNLNVYQTTAHNSIRRAAAISDDTLFAASNSALYRSTDGGAHWLELAGGSISSMLVLPGGNIVITSYDNQGIIVLTSPNAGVSWANISGGAQHLTDITNMILAGNSLYLIGVTGVLKATLLTTSIQEQRPSAMAARVFPIPASTSVNIVFCLPTTSPVHLVVYNATGQLVATLLEQEMPGGEHTIQWNTQEVQPGAYYYSLCTGTSATTGAFLVNGR